MNLYVGGRLLSVKQSVPLDSKCYSIVVQLVDLDLGHDEYSKQNGKRLQHSLFVCLCAARLGNI